MADLSLPARDSIAAQSELFRRADAEHGLSLAVLSKRTPIPLSTLKGWRDGAAMPAWALGALGEAGVPDHLLTLLLHPFSRAVVTTDDDEGDLDTAAVDAGELVSLHARARHPSSPGGIAIVPQEAALLRRQIGRVAAACQRAAA